jgi:hypothetical protein
MNDDTDEPMPIDQIDDIIKFSPLGELTQILTGAVSREEPGTLIVRVKISSLNELASRWLIRGLTTNFHSFILELAQQIPQLVELDDEYIYVYTIAPGHGELVAEVTNAMAVRYFVYDIEDEIHSLGPNSLRKMLEELATLMGESVNPYLLEPATIN